MGGGEGIGRRNWGKEEMRRKRMRRVEEDGKGSGGGIRKIRENDEEEDVGGGESGRGRIRRVEDDGDEWSRRMGKRSRM